MGLSIFFAVITIGLIIIAAVVLHQENKKTSSH